MLWFRRFVYQARVPLVLLLLTVSVDIAALLSIIPSSTEIFGRLSDAIETLPKPVIALLSFAEHTVGLNVYFPGAIVILVAMGGTYGSISAAIEMFFIILAGQFFGYFLSFLVGRSFKNRNDQTVKMKSQLGLFLTFAHPHSGALTSLALGSSGMKPGAFIVFLILSLSVWSTFWAVVSYNGLVAVVGEVGWDTVFYSYMAIWLIWIAFGLVRSR